MQKLATPQQATLENFFLPVWQEAKKKKLFVVLKTDVQNSLEALVTSLQ